MRIMPCIIFEMLQLSALKFLVQIYQMLPDGNFVLSGERDPRAGDRQDRRGITVSWANTKYGAFRGQVFKKFAGKNKPGWLKNTKEQDLRTFHQLHGLCVRSGGHEHQVVSQSRVEYCVHHR